MSDSQVPPTHRRYSSEFKERAVRMVRQQLSAETGQHLGSIKRVADQLAYGVESLRSWVKQTDVDDGVRSGVTTSDADRIKGLDRR